jgi:hypothetical protein
VETQSINCRLCRFYSVNVAIKRAQVVDGQFVRNGINRFVTNHTFVDRQLIPDAGVGRIYSPDVVPPEINRDYAEAHGVLQISSRAAAMLARRCLQQILLDAYGVKARTTLHAQLFEARAAFDDQLFDALMTVKSIANEAAHDLGVVADVDASDVLIMLRAIEYLIDDTYVRRQRRADDLDRVTELVGSKKSLTS